MLGRHGLDKDTLTREVGLNRKRLRKFLFQVVLRTVNIDHLISAVESFEFEMSDSDKIHYRRLKPFLDGLAERLLK